MEKGVLWNMAYIETDTSTFSVQLRGSHSQQVRVTCRMVELLNRIPTLSLPEKCSEGNRGVVGDPATAVRRRLHIFASGIKVHCLVWAARY